jgi:UDP-N-acetylmuramoyl-L-alanyl-D-glutamate--2,6-diaminopimelate ligase
MIHKNLIQIINKYIDKNLDPKIKNKIINKLKSPEFSQSLLNKKASLNSKEIKPGDIFFAYPGENSDGRDYIKHALNNGAKLIIYESLNLNSKPNLNSDLILNNNINYIAIPIPNLKNKISLFAKNLYPLNNNTNITAITGTNGKSSTCHYLAQIYNNNKITNIDKTINIITIGTLGYFLYNNNKKKLTNSSHTTPDQLNLWRNIYDFQINYSQINNNLNINTKTNIILEASSHALDNSQKRLEHLPIDTAIFTNFSQDHLDYHKNIDNYFTAKLNLFSKFDTLKYAVIHLDPLLTESQQKLLINTLNTKNIKYYNYAINNISKKNTKQNTKPNINFYFKKIIYNHNGFETILNTPWGEINTDINLYGEFNLANMLGAYITYILQNKVNNIVSAKNSAKILPSITALNGRMMKIKDINHNKIFIDYAHTPDAIKQALKALKSHFPGYNLIILFGCGGDRDRSKRNLMTKAALSYANNLILTNDNPRSESTEQIFNDMIADISLCDEKHIKIIPDREQAILYTLKKHFINKDNRNILLLAGKGHETNITIKNKIIQCDEKEIVSRFFNSQEKHTCYNNN